MIAIRMKFFRGEFKGEVECDTVAKKLYAAIGAELGKHGLDTEVETLIEYEDSPLTEPCVIRVSTDLGNCCDQDGFCSTVGFDPQEEDAKKAFACASTAWKNFEPVECERLWDNISRKMEKKL
ncbi:MAG: hypothetical protein CMB80_01085 [Flammeovirgaceae bacterium]|nr:hypothetical protein [Flammeovirgaceae bacterium]|tara:strand:+ start:3350 stop:3718 length:369 start_codon:yes stop_codon:yes gene_type:complete